MKIRLHRNLPLVAFLFFGSVSWATYPTWWGIPANASLEAEYTNGIPAADYSPLLLGQLKYLADKARTELDTVLAPVGGAGAEIDALVDSFVVDATDASPANIGQLKYVASQFFNRFAAIGYQPGSTGWNPAIVLNEGAGDNSPLYPWKDDVTAEANSPALLGQLKFLFSWDIATWASIDSEDNGDGTFGDDLPDWWERYYFSTLAHDGSYTVVSGGLTLAEAYASGTDPTDFFNGSPAYIRALGGDAQTATPGTFMADRLTVSVTDAAGTELVGAPVSFVVNEGDHSLAADPSSLDRYEAVILINSSEGSSVAFEAPLAKGTSTVTASLPNGESLTFTLYTVDAEAKERRGVTNLKEVENDDGTSTFTWRAGPADGDFFKLQTLRPDGTSRVFYETTYGSTDLPYTPGQTVFSLTVPTP